MTDTTARCLDLLGLLQTYRYWSGTELADRLGVTERTLRRDVDRLRELGYRIDASRGVGGGYRLASGTTLPPLLLNDDEVVAIAVGLRAAATRGLAGSAEITVSALAKLEQVLPKRLHRRIRALAAVESTTRPGGPEVAAEALAQLALVCRDPERIRFDYVAADGAGTSRDVEPQALVSSGQRWYLVAWDRDRVDWRVFRVDRISAVAPTGQRVNRRELPAEHAAEMIQVASAGARTTSHEAQVLLHVPWSQFTAHFGPWGRHAVETPEGVLWPIGGRSHQELASALLWIPPDWQYEVRAEPELLAFLRDAGAGLARV